MFDYEKKAMLHWSYINIDMCFFQYYVMQQPYYIPNIFLSKPLDGFAFARPLYKILTPEQS